MSIVGGAGRAGVDSFTTPASHRLGGAALRRVEGAVRPWLCGAWGGLSADSMAAKFPNKYDSR